MKFLKQKNLWTRTVTVLVVLLLSVESFVIGVSSVQAEEIISEQEIAVEQIKEETNPHDSIETSDSEAIKAEEEDEEPKDTSPEKETAELEGDAVIETGDALASAQVSSEVNSNETQTDETASTSVSEGDAQLAENASNADDEIIETEGEEAESTSVSAFDFIPSEDSEVLASSTNEALIETTATVTAKTGENVAVGETATINTGNAVAVANIVNLANTNILNSEGFIGFFDSLGFGYTDLSNMFTVFESSVSASTAPCAENICGDSAVTVNNNNEAIVENHISVTANTGENVASGAEDASVLTGNAYAAANVFNVVNTNITNSNYLLLSFNNFGSYNGDIVLPNSSVFSELFDQTSGVSGPVVINDNEANIDNALAVAAETGNNEATGGEIVSGNSFASGNVVNQVNQNLFGSDSFLLVLRVHGDWSGDIFGLPEGVSWQETERGIELFSEGSGSGSQNRNTTVTNNNTATVTNDVSVYALTGENKASEGGSIETGNAYAGGNIVNLVNTNILGQNWATLVFDIFGDWDGHLTFGQPDLWVGAQAEAQSNRILDGDEVLYTFTVTNFGDVTAENVSLKSFFSNYDLSFTQKPVQFDENRYAHFSEGLGSISPGQTVSLQARGTIGSLPHNKEISIPLTVEVTSEQSESDMDNNRDTVTVLAGWARSDNNDPRNSFGTKIQLEKTASTDLVKALPAQVDYVVTLENTAGKAYHGVLIDTFYDPNGEVIHEERWELGTIGRETITVEYSLEFTDDMPSGIYRNEAQVVALDRHESIHHGIPYLSEVAVVEVTVGGPDGQVLGISTDCPAYITQFMQFGSNNDEEEVLKLQTFLNEELKTDIEESGVFDIDTHDGVQQFQTKYREQVLLPWNMAYPTGYVYLTTRKKINEIYCRGARDFPLTGIEKVEIERYRFVGQQSITTPQDVGHQSGVTFIKAETAVANRRDDLLPTPDAPEIDPKPKNDRLNEQFVEPMQQSRGFLRPLLDVFKHWLPFVSR